MAKIKNAQSILEFVFAFIAIILLTVALVRIWLWFSANYAKQQSDYQTSRLTAGDPEHPGKAYEYQPLNLTENWVFKGDTEGQRVSGLDYEDPPEPPEQKCQEECQSQCATGSGFNFNCPCYTKCLCLADSQPIIDSYRSNADALDGGRDDCQGGQAGQLYDMAEDMRDKAKDCDDWWEICWWFGGGWTANELKKGARKIERQADDLCSQAKNLRKTASNIEDCCDKHTVEEQEECTEGILEGMCPTLIDAAKFNWNDEKGDLEEEKADINQKIIDLDNIITGCGASAADYCSFYYLPGTPAYNVCYENRRDACCKDSSGDPDYQRGCDFPISPCDNCPPYPIPPCPPYPVTCSLSEMIRRYNCRITKYIDPLIITLNNLLSNVGNCCGPDIDALQCISDFNKLYTNAEDAAEEQYKACKEGM